MALILSTPANPGLGTQLNQIVTRDHTLPWRAPLNALVRSHGKGKVAGVLADLIGDMADSGAWNVFDTDRAEHMMEFLLRRSRSRKQTRSNPKSYELVVHTWDGESRYRGDASSPQAAVENFFTDEVESPYKTKKIQVKQGGRVVYTWEPPRASW